mgnify:CR=1 FL=1
MESGIKKENVPSPPLPKITNNYMEDKTQKEKIREIMTDFDIKQRLFLNGKYHSTQFNKWFEQTAKDIADLTIKETEERIVREIEGFNIERYARNESNMPSVKNLKEDILALIRNK